jgi:hypothetical protein
MMRSAGFQASFIPQNKVTSWSFRLASAMKLLTEYLERAITLERLAASEKDSDFKTQLLNQAAAYRRLAAKRAELYGMPAPSPPEIPDGGAT